MCADVRKHQNTPGKSDYTSPTVSNESLLITTDIDLYENKDVAIIDVPGVFLTAYMEE